MEYIVCGSAAVAVSFEVRDHHVARRSIAAERNRRDWRGRRLMGAARYQRAASRQIAQTDAKIVGVAVSQRHRLPRHGLILPSRARVGKSGSEQSGGVAEHHRLASPLREIAGQPPVGGGCGIGLNGRGLDAQFTLEIAECRRAELKAPLHAAQRYSTGSAMRAARRRGNRKCRPARLLRVRIHLAIHPDRNLLVIPTEADSEIAHRGKAIGSGIGEQRALRLRAVNDLGEAVIVIFGFREDVVIGTRSAVC